MAYCGKRLHAMLKLEQGGPRWRRRTRLSNINPSATAKNSGLRRSSSGLKTISTVGPQGQPWRRNSRVSPALPENISQKTGALAERIIQMIRIQESNHIGRSSRRRAAPLRTVSLNCSRLGMNLGAGADSAASLISSSPSNHSRTQSAQKASNLTSSALSSSLKMAPNAQISQWPWQSWSPGQSQINCLLSSCDRNPRRSARAARDKTVGGHSCEIGMNLLKRTGAPGSP